MTDQALQILENALHLLQADRAFIAQKLLESLGTNDEFQVDEEWRAEIKRRCEQIDNGDVQLIPGEEVFKEARELLG